MERQEEDEEDEENSILRDRFRLSAVSIANAQAKSIEMEVSETVVACISDMAFKFTEQLGKDVEMFAQHGGRVSVNMEDVILSAHRNEHLLASLRCFADELKSHSLQPQRKRKKAVTNKPKAQSPQGS